MTADTLVATNGRPIGPRPHPRPKRPATSPEVFPAGDSESSRKSPKPSPEPALQAFHRSSRTRTLLTPRRLETKAAPVVFPIMLAAMPVWRAIEQTEPEFAGRVRRLFDAGRHKTIATLRADGSPRISGIECEFTDGNVRFGSMTGARKGADLDRDSRFALHGPTFHPEPGSEKHWPGEAKIAGRAVPIGPVAAAETSQPSDGDRFVADITEIVLTELNAEATKLVVTSWTPAAGLRRVERD
jgi:hypothetical protein